MKDILDRIAGALGAVFGPAPQPVPVPVRAGNGRFPRR